MDRDHLEKSFPIDRAHPACVDFELLLPDLVEALRSLKSYVTINLVLRGIRAQQARPTIVIHGRRPLSIKLALQDLVYPNSLKLLIWAAQPRLQHDGYSDDGVHIKSLQYYESPPRGVSIGSLEGDQTCTLGGYLVDSDGKLYAMTCYHGLVTDKNEPLEGKTPSIVFQPSTSDFVDLRHRLERHVADGTASGRVENPKVQEAKVLLAIYNDLKGAQYRLGDFVAGECRVPPDGTFWEDWALIKVHPNRAVDASNSSPWDRTEFVAGPAQAKPGDLVSKVGRTTGLRTGFVNGPLGVKIATGGDYTRELTIVPSAGGDFSYDGDSGAWVINELNEVVGMVIAGDPLDRDPEDPETADGPFSFMTDFGHILRCIKVATQLDLNVLTK